MPAERFPHLFLPGPSDTQSFTSKGGGGSKPRLPVRDRAAHGARIESRLSAAWKAAEAASAVASATRDGYYLEFVLAAGSGLSFTSLENRKSRIRLLNVRTGGEANSFFATVFIPNGKLGHFVRRVKSYLAETTPQGTPKHQALIATIEDVKHAALNAFWTDRTHPLPGDEPVWIEAWLNSDGDETIERFRKVVARLEIREHEHKPVLRFPERSVLLIHANRNALSELIVQSDELAEFRAARQAASVFTNMPVAAQTKRVRELLGRIEPALNSDVSVCILDHGINRQHPLIESVLASDDMHSVRSEWKTHDHHRHGHGTLMAGTAAYGDLQHALESQASVRIAHRLESAKILPPSPGENPRHLWGRLTADGISLAEIQAPHRRRIVCMAVTSPWTRQRGHPSSWSAEIDQLAAGVDDGPKRLILLSGGNIDPQADLKNYPLANEVDEIHDPAQAWNAVTVGAFTERIRIEDPSLDGYEPMAESGGLSPYSTTSLTWRHSDWPIKPEVLFEGGNIARSPQGEPADIEDLALVSTRHDFAKSLLGSFNATSAATAKAAWAAAQIQATYPDAWPETVRGLLVHSAEWTPEMKRQFLDAERKTAYKKLLRTCGYGVPDLNRALCCLRSSLTLVSEAELQPFDKRAKPAVTYSTREMHLYRLPWPNKALLDLGETIVQMRVTLSYFVEPGPGEVGWRDRYRYASHGLRFKLNSPAEEEAAFVRRINRQAWDEDEAPQESSTAPDNWILGQQRDVGSIHSDIWRGTAAALATSNLIAVHPTIGWWRERHHLNKWDKKCRYSLIVSIRTRQQDVDIYTPVANQIGIPNPIPIPIEIPTG